MTFSDWLNEDWDKVMGAIKNLPDEGPMALWNKFRRDRFEKRGALVKVEPQPEAKEDVSEAQKWWDQLLGYAEQGRKAAEEWFAAPGADIAKQLSGDEGGDPIATIVRRLVGQVGSGLYRLTHFLLVKVLHLPAMYKFFRHDTLQIGKDAVKGVKLAAKNPGDKRAWGAATHHLLNLARYPVAAVMMGIGAKLSYQQYQLLQSLGFTDIALADVAKANVVLCWLMFLCFLTPHWLANAEHKVLKGLSTVMRNMFPQQMYKHKSVKAESRVLNTTMTRNFREWADDYQLLVEDVSRYSVEVNYRTTKKELLNSWSKLVLGFVSAALQREGYHVKHVYTEKPQRIMVSTNNWDDGAWTGMLLFNPEKECFVLSSGFWNKDRKTISIQRQDTDKCAEDAAADLVRKMINFMHDLRGRDPRRLNTLKPAPMKRGPKK